MNRRELMMLIGGAAAWPVAARAQQAAVPVIGWLSGRSSVADALVLPAFRKGLNEAGYLEGKNVTVEFRWSDGQYDRLPVLAADLVRRPVTTIAAMGGAPPAVAAKAATTTIPIVFQMGADPVQLGLVASLNRPGGNLTGISSLNVEVGPKRLELLHELVPTASVVAILVNPTNPNAETLTRTTQAAARNLGLQLNVLNASAERDFDAAFADVLKMRASALVIGTDTFFTNQSKQLAALSLRHAVPTIYQFHEFTAAGGLMSYGGNLADEYRLVGVYTGRILKGERPADLPVQQVTKVELIINLKTAKGLGITVPPSLLTRADEVVE
jgi:putative ABC transport system substrate-binding protein